MRHFKVFALIILTACNIRAEFTKEEILAILADCKDEAGASDADFETIFFKHLPAETTEGKCMSACAYRKFGLMNDEGKIIKDAAIGLIKNIIKGDKKELAAGIHDFCDGLVTSDDHCEAATEYDSCVKHAFDSKRIVPAEDLLY